MLEFLSSLQSAVRDQRENIKFSQFVTVHQYPFMLLSSGRLCVILVLDLSTFICSCILSFVYPMYPLQYDYGVNRVLESFMYPEKTISAI